MDTLDSRILAAIPVRSVSELPNFPFANYAAFQQALKDGKASVFCRYNPSTCRVLGSPADSFLHLVLVSAPPLMALVTPLVAYFYGSLWLLLCIPAAIAGWMLTSPGWLRGGGKFVLLLAFCLLVYGMLWGSTTQALVAGAFLVANVITILGREYSYVVARAAAAESEPRLLYLLLNEIIMVRNVP